MNLDDDEFNANTDDPATQENSPLLIVKPERHSAHQIILLTLSARYTSLPLTTAHPETFSS